MVHRAQILPKRLQVRYRIWLETIHAAQKIQFRALADLGQDPLEMVIACCDNHSISCRISNNRFWIVLRTSLPCFNPSNSRNWSIS